MAKGRIENLIQNKDRTPEEVRENCRKGGIKSGIVRKEKKLMSQILSEYLQKEHKVILYDDEGNPIDSEKLSAPELIDRTVTAILNRGDGASASMIKTLGELTEGKLVKLSGDDENPLAFKFVEPPSGNTK